MLNLKAGILKARGVIYRMIIIITIKQKPEAIIFVVGVVLLTLTRGGGKGGGSPGEQGREGYGRREKKGREAGSL